MDGGLIPILRGVSFIKPPIEGGYGPNLAVGSPPDDRD
jgi:hypothetical protein